MWALSELVEAAVRTGDTERGRGGARPARASTRGAQRHRLGAGHRGARARAADARARPPRASTARRSSASGARGCARSSPARTCSTASGCAARAGACDAREQLRAAHELLVAIGMEAFAERARRELLATGEKVRKRAAETRDELTPQEEPDRPARPRRPVEPGDRRPAVPQPAHRRVAPAQGVHQARDQLAHGPARRAAQRRTRRPRPRRCRTSSSRSPTRRTRPRPS